MFVGHNPDRLIQLLKVETEEGLRRSIIQNLGQMGSSQGTDALLSLYGTDKDVTVRRAIIDALSNQQNAKVLIELARKETDPALKKRIVERLSNVKSSEATDYFLELLSKP
jgi:HEAT repeat protein